MLGTGMKDEPPLQPLYWVGSSKKDLKALPKRVIDVFGYALYLAQSGRKHGDTKPLKGFGSGRAMEVLVAYEGNTYRAVYMLRPRVGVFVLHVFQKKSKRGIATPKRELKLIRERWKAAEEMAKESES